MTGYWAAFPVLYNNSLFINICIPQSASLICMFLVNPLPCGGHSLSGLWGCESLVNTVVMKPPMRKLRGQSSLCVLAPSASGFSGNHLFQIQQEEIKPLVGTLDSRTRASSLCCVPLSFNDLVPMELLGTPPSKQSLQDIPWRLTGELPPSPQLRDPAQPHTSGSLSLNITQRAPCRWGRHLFPQAQDL